MTILDLSEVKKLETIERKCGIYFLFLDNEVVYIGQSINVHSRILSNHYSGPKKHDKAVFLPVPQDQLNELETKYIHYYKPKYNFSKAGKLIVPDNHLLKKIEWLEDDRDGFTKHGLTHSSPSQINMFAAAPCAWVAKYMYGRKFSFSLAPRAGVLAEEAIVNVPSNGWTRDDAVWAAVEEYNKQAAFCATDAERKRGEGIPGMIDGALEMLAEYGEPEFETDFSGKKQKAIELICNGDGWKLPVIGYLDFWYPKHGLVIDLKTAMKMPSSMSDEHTRQGAVYKAAMGNHTVKFLYVTPKKAELFEIGDTAPVLAEIKTILNRQERLLRLDAETIRDVVPVIAGSFYWNGDEDIRRELYGI